MRKQTPPIPRRAGAMSSAAMQIDLASERVGRGLAPAVASSFSPASQHVPRSVNGEGNVVGGEVPALRRRTTLGYLPPETDVTFSPVREKVTKERTAVALNAAGRRHKRCSGQGGMRRLPCSGGIVTQPAKMWLSEYRIAAVCAFEQGKIGRGGWCLPLGADGLISRVGRGLAPAVTSSFSPASQRGHPIYL